ncbi:MAG: hypothetical protein GWO24_33645 [Akkermansiaceae bacterium]|nr:hypothetical protein [Akkermansiaceae bacterium]
MPDDNSKDPDPAESASSAEGEGVGSSGLPEERRLVRKRRKKRGSSRQTLFLKKREILREMHEEDEGPVVGVKEQVARLQSARKKAKAEKEGLEEHWGGPVTRHRGFKWFLLRVFAVTIPIMAIVAAFLLMQDDEEGELMMGFDPELKLGPEEEEALPYPSHGAEAWFTENPHEAYETSVGLLDLLNQSLEGELPFGILRHQETAEKRIAARGLGWSSRFFTADPAKLSWATSRADHTGFIALDGKRENHTRFRCYFVKVEDGLRLDWEASTAWCEVPIGELAEARPEEPVLVRGIIRKEPNYDTDRGPGSLNSRYLLESADGDAYIWAFVPKGSALDNKMRRLFGFGSLILERRNDVRVTLRLRKAKEGFQENEFEIEEFVAEEWVVPEGSPFK